jgi:hypothetical protein
VCGREIVASNPTDVRQVKSEMTRFKIGLSINSGRRERYLRDANLFTSRSLVSSLPRSCISPPDWPHFHFLPHLTRRPTHTCEFHSFSSSPIKQTHKLCRIWTTSLSAISVHSHQAYKGCDTTQQQIVRA